MIEIIWIEDFFTDFLIFFLKLEIDIWIYSTLPTNRTKTITFVVVGCVNEVVEGIVIKYGAVLIQSNLVTLDT